MSAYSSIFQHIHKCFSQFQPIPGISAYLIVFQYLEKEWITWISPFPLHHNDQTTDQMIKHQQNIEPIQISNIFCWIARKWNSWVRQYWGQKSLVGRPMKWILEHSLVVTMSVTLNFVCMSPPHAFFSSRPLVVSQKKLSISRPLIGPEITWSVTHSKFTHTKVTVQRWPIQK